MAEETKTGNSAGQPATASDNSKEEALVTEQPVPSVPQEKTSQYVVTVDNQTGLAVKIEKLDDTGARKEFSPEEYQQALMGANASSTFFETELQGNELAVFDEKDPLVAAYYQGAADYLKALT